MQLEHVLPAHSNPPLLQHYLQLLADRNATHHRHLTQLQQRHQQLLHLLNLSNPNTASPQMLFELYQTCPQPEQQLALLRQAASLGLTAAQQRLAECYEQGLGGLTKNPLAAAYWFGLANSA